jgi:hypothetical protein
LDTERDLNELRLEQEYGALGGNVKATITHRTITVEVTFDDPSEIGRIPARKAANEALIADGHRLDDVYCTGVHLVNYDKMEVTYEVGK